MKCPYCTADLEHEDEFGTKEFIVYGDQRGKTGDIYKCPNSDGFDDTDQAYEFLANIEESLESLGAESIEDVPCENDHGNAFYYTYEGDNELHEGYPC